MAAATGTTRASLRPSVRVDAKLQALAVNVVGKRLNAGREVFRIGNDISVLIA